jgi:pyruvate dehydrogenase E2 component (dihydrolipoamide acetyltransferase)
MVTTFHLPDLGEGLPDAEIVAWQVGVGDHIVADQPLLSVETDKAVVEIPSSQAGRIAALHGAPGDRVRVGAPLVEIESAHAVDAGAIVGEVPTTLAVSPPAAPAVAAASVGASPAVRRRAAARGLDLATIVGSGPDGSVTMADVDAAAVGPASGAEPLSGVRRAMLQRMTRAGREVVRATVTGEADIHAWPAGTDVTLRLVRAVAAACEASPSLHAGFDAATEVRTLHRRLDLGIAMDSDDGLFVPVLRDAGRRSADELRAQLEVLKAQVAGRTLPREALAGATFTLSNFGMHGGRFAELVVMPPQVAILGAGRAEPRCVVVDGAAAVRRMLPLSLSFDHRVVTGVEAARFLAAAIDDLRRP